MAAAALVLGYWGRGEWFANDDLGYAVRLATDPLGHTLLHPPPDKYLIAFPLLVYKALFETFGMDSYRPYRLTGILLVLLCAGLLFVLLRRWLPERFAVPPTLLMLFFGAGWEVVVTPIRIPSQIALAAGLGMMLVLERRDRRGDLAAMTLLAISLGSHPVGISFAAAGAVMVILSSRDGWMRLWVIVIPGVLFAAWWLFIRPPEYASFPNTADAVFVFVRQSWVGLIAAVSGLFGVLGQPAYHQTPAKVACRCAPPADRARNRLRPKSPTADLLGSPSRSGGSDGDDSSRAGGVSPSAGWIQVPLPGGLLPPDRARRPGRQPEASRLVHVGGVGRAADQVFGPTSIGCTTRAEYSVSNRRDTGCNSRRWTSPDRVPGPDSGSVRSPRPLRNTWRPFAPSGRPATRPLKSQGTRGLRSTADVTGAGALGLRLEPAPRPPRGGAAPRVADPRIAATSKAGCTTVRARAGAGKAATGSAGVEFVLPRGGAWLGLSQPADADVHLGRFADEATVPLRQPAGAAGLQLRIPPDQASVPWRLLVSSQSRITVCGLSGGPP